MEEMPFLAFRQGRNTFDFRCPSCRAEGELGVKPETTTVECPNKCGARFMVRKPKGLFAKPYLEYVFGGKQRKRK